MGARDLRFEDAWFTAADGTKLHGWYLPVDNPRAYLLFAHGNAGHLAHRAPLLEYLQNELGVAVLAFDYRGYGRSQGRPSEAGILEDARAARDWLAERAHLPADGVVLMGESIGGAVVVDVAAADGGTGADPGKHLHIAARRGSVSVSPGCRCGCYCHAARFAGKNSELPRPVARCHGTSDTVVPFALGQQLFEAANEPKRLVVINGGDHNTRADRNGWRRSTSSSLICRPPARPNTTRHDSLTRGRSALAGHRSRRGLVWLSAS